MLLILASMERGPGSFVGPFAEIAYLSLLRVQGQLVPPSSLAVTTYSDFTERR